MIEYYKKNPVILEDWEKIKKYLFFPISYLKSKKKRRIG
jgi:hypothetical protein